MGCNLRCHGNVLTVSPAVVPVPSPGEHQICPAVCVLMKLSFDEEHRHAMNELGETHFLSHFLSVFVVFPTGCLCDLQPDPRSVPPPLPPGGLQAIAELLQADCELYGLSADHQSITLRRYAGMALTNLTFGDVGNKVPPCVARGSFCAVFCVFCV